MNVAAAGAVVLRGDELVLTLNRDESGSERVRVGWVGGALEPGEAPRECLAREAVEELGVPVDVVPAATTFAWDWERRVLEETDRAGGDRPLVVVRYPDGRLAVVYLGSLDRLAPLSPGDVVGLLLLPRPLWGLVVAGVTVGEARRAGAHIAPAALPPATRLWLHPHASLRPAVTLLPA